MLDRKTGEHVDLLFAMRARRVAKTYINATVIPLLCRKAGVPAADARGSITSHRARSTIASSSASWPTPRRRQGPRPVSWSTTPQDRRSCKSSEHRAPPCVGGRAGSLARR